MVNYCQILYRLVRVLVKRSSGNSSELASQEPHKTRLHKRRTCGTSTFTPMRATTSFRETVKTPTPEEIQLLKTSFQQWIHTRRLSGPAQATLPTKMTRFQIDADENILEDPHSTLFSFVLVRGSAAVIADGKTVQLLHPGSMFGHLCEVNGDSDEGILISLENCVLWGLHKDDLSESLRQTSLEISMPMQRLLDLVPLISELKHSQKECLVDLLQSEYWPRGTRIPDTHDTQNSLWIVVSGKLKCLNTSRILKPDEYFGGALELPGDITDVVTLEESVLVTLSKTEVEVVLHGSVAEALTRNLLSDALAGSESLNVLNPAQVTGLLRTIQVHEYAAERLIVPAGQLKSSKLLILIKGAVRYGPRNQASPRCFGDKALTSGKKSVYAYDLVADTAVTIGECTKEELECCLQLWLGRLRSVNKLVKLFKNMPLFCTLPKEKLRQLALTVKTRRYAAEAVIFKQGSKGDSLFIVKRGHVTIRKQQVALRKLSAYSHFGEHSLLTGKVRTADAVASAGTHCWVLAKADLLNVIDDRNQAQLVQRMMLQDDSITLSSLAAVMPLGEGAFGKVFLCAHKQTGAHYAVKVMDLGTISRYNSFKQVELERKILLELDHPFIMKLVKILKDRYRVYYVMEYARGISFHDTLYRLGTQDEPNTRFYAGCLLLILQYLHKKSIVFRDLKPANIIVDQEGYLKLVDFGTAKVVQGRTYTIVGTPHYMAPEVVLGQGYSQTADLWSLGVILYEVAFGTVPFGRSAMTMNEIFKEVTEGVYPRFETEGFSPEFSELLAQLLSRKPYLRNLGNTASLRKHAWFHDFHWVSTRQSQLSVRALKPSHVPYKRGVTVEAGRAIRSSVRLSRLMSRSPIAPMFPIKQDAIDWLASF